MYYENKEYKITKIGEGDTYNVLVKATGEVTTATPDVVRVIWSSDAYTSSLVEKDLANGLMPINSDNEDGYSLEETIASGGERDVENAVIRKLTLEEQISKLTNIERKVFSFHCIEGYSLRDTASILSQCHTTVDECKKRIRNKFTENS